MTVRKVVLGVGGGIAAFKAAALCSQLVQRGLEVRVAMTAAACSFIGPLTFEALTGNSVILSTTQIDTDGTAPHIQATRDADCFVVAPATADLIARMAAGFADDPVCLAAVAVSSTRAKPCRRIVCPAMNDAMWESAVVQRNVRGLTELGFEMLGPDTGYLADGYAAVGRLVEPQIVIDALLGSA